MTGSLFVVWRMGYTLYLEPVSSLTSSFTSCAALNLPQYLKNVNTHSTHTEEWYFTTCLLLVEQWLWNCIMCEIFLISDILLTMSSSTAGTDGSDDNTAADTKWTQLRKGQCSDVVVHVRESTFLVIEDWSVKEFQILNRGSSTVL